MAKKITHKDLIKIDYILNAAILTDWGIYEFIEYNENSMELDFSNALSAVGHAATAIILSHLFGIKIKENRIEIKMRKNECSLIFRLKVRPPEGKILSYEELQNYDYVLGILKKIK